MSANRFHKHEAKLFAKFMGHKMGGWSDNENKPGIRTYSVCYYTVCGADLRVELFLGSKNPKETQWSGDETGVALYRTCEKNLKISGGARSKPQAPWEFDE